MTYSPLAAIANHPNVISKVLQDEISTKNVFIWWLMGKPVDTGAGLKPTAKRFFKEQEGGSRFEVLLMLNTNSNIKSYEKDATFSMNVNDIGDRAYYDIKSVGGPTPIYGFDEDVSMNSKTNVINIVKAYLDQAAIGVENKLQAMLMAAPGTARTEDFESLLDQIAEDPTDDTIGEIASATYSNWRNQYYDASSDSLATYLKTRIDTYKINATFGVKGPKLMVMTPTIYGTLQGQLTALQRYVPDTELVKAGFTGMQYDGMSCVFDGTIQAGSILGINPEAFEYGVLKGCNMKHLPPVRVPNADLKAGFIKHRGNVICKDRRTNFCLFNFVTD